MRKRDDDISSNRRERAPFLFVVLVAVFLLVGIGVGINAIFGSSDTQVNMLLMRQAPQTEIGVVSAKIRSDQTGNFEAPELVLLGETSVMAVTPSMTVTAQALGSIIGGSLPARSDREVARYVVEEGDTISALAEHFGVSVNTIAWANDTSSSVALVPGEELVILPVSGALHLVRPADTLSEIAAWYKADMQEILEFNSVVSAQEIFAGDLLIIPGGAKPSRLPSGRLTPLANSYFIYPIPRAYRITQGLHPFNAADFADGSCGGPVYAAAGGVVQRVEYNNGYGNYVRVLHPNGVVTLYAHLSSQVVGAGERVLQGQILGYVGHTGRTIPAGKAGCHLHFEVRGATNPFLK